MSLKSSNTEELGPQLSHKGPPRHPPFVACFQHARMVYDVPSFGLPPADTRVHRACFRSAVPARLERPQADCVHRQCALPFLAGNPQIAVKHCAASCGQLLAQTCLEARPIQYRHTQPQIKPLAVNRPRIPGPSYAGRTPHLPRQNPSSERIMGWSLSICDLCAALKAKEPNGAK